MMSHHRDTLIGRVITLNATSGSLRPCLKCGARRGRIGAGRGPHLFELRCTQCGYGPRWIGRELAESLLGRELTEDDLYDLSKPDFFRPR
jgi:hypothetical protein